MGNFVKDLAFPNASEQRRVRGERFCSFVIVATFAGCFAVARTAMFVDTRTTKNLRIRSVCLERGFVWSRFRVESSTLDSKDERSSHREKSSSIDDRDGNSSEFAVETKKNGSDFLESGLVRDGNLRGSSALSESACFGAKRPSNLT